MNKIEKKFNQNDYTPKRFGLKYNPPQIVVEYLTPSTGKLYHHKIRLGKFKPETNLQEVVKEIYEKHYMYLDNKKVNPAQIVRLIEKLKDKRKASGANSYNSYDDKSREKENLKIDPKNIPDDKESSQKQTTSPNKVDINELDDEEEDYYKFFDYENEDLNKLDTSELKKRKDQMEKLYEKNAVLPGDEKFVFDVRVRNNNKQIIFLKIMKILMKISRFLTNFYFL